jgi:hypothetical protein
MGATTQPTTFLDLFTDLMNRMKAETTTTAVSDRAKRYINMALHDFHIQHNWWWAERRGVVITQAPYKVGSVSVASSTRTTLEGTNTLWNTTAVGMGTTFARALGKVKISGDDDVYIVSSVGSNTSLTTVDRVTFKARVDSAASAYVHAYASYSYYEDEYALAPDFYRLVDLRTFSDQLNIPVIPSGQFYARYPRNSSATGTPHVCTIIEVGPGSTVALRPRVLFHPVPDTVITIPYRYQTTYLAVSSGGTGQVNLSADTDEPIVPLRYRHVLIPYAAFVWYRDLKNDERSQESYSEYTDLVKRIAGDTNPQQDRPRMVPARMRFQPLTRLGSRRRFDTESKAFDELRD